MKDTILTPARANAYSPLALAFLGDCIYERQVRLHILLAANMPASELHKRTIRLVCADFQASAVRLLSPVLTDEELSVYKRGRNAKSHTMPKNTCAAHYRSATGLEALFGYLYLTGRFDRIDELSDMIFTSDENGIDISAISLSEPDVCDENSN